MTVCRHEPQCWLTVYRRTQLAHDGRPPMLTASINSVDRAVTAARDAAHAVSASSELIENDD